MTVLKIQVDGSFKPLFARFKEPPPAFSIARPIGVLVSNFSVAKTNSTLYL